MISIIIKIVHGKCDGCGLCIEACHEGAIGIVDSKAQLLRDDYCVKIRRYLPRSRTIAGYTAGKTYLTEV